MILTIAGICSVILVVVAVHNRALAVAAVLFLLPTYVLRFSVSGIPFTVLEALILVLFCTFVVQERKRLWNMICRPRLFTGSWLFWLAVLFIVAGILGVVVSPSQTAALGLLKAYIVEPLLFVLVLIHTIRTPKEVRQVVWALGLSATFIALIAVFQFVTGVGIPEPWQQFPDRRATAVYGFPNAVGLYIAPILTLFIGLLAHKKFGSRQRTVAALVMIVAMAASLVAARVDGAIIAVVAGSVVALFFTEWRRRTVIALVVALALAFILPATRELLLFQDVSGDVRLALWKGTWNLLQEQPLFGTGLAGFPLVYDIYRLPSHVELLQYPHNVLLNMWVELGMLGVLWLIAVLVYGVRAAVNVGRRHAVGYVLLAVLVSFVVYGLVDVPYFKNDLSVLFWTWLGLLAVLQRARKA